VRIFRRGRVRGNHGKASSAEAFIGSAGVGCRKSRRIKVNRCRFPLDGYFPECGGVRSAMRVAGSSRRGTHEQREENPCGHEDPENKKILHWSAAPFCRHMTGRTINFAENLTGIKERRFFLIPTTGAPSA
jgi:hypothetical protein